MMERSRPAPQGNNPQTPIKLSKYQEHLASLPAPGGNGCHVALLGVANQGISAGLPSDEIFADIRAAIPQGKRIVTDREIMDAVNRAAQDHNGATLPSGETYHRYRPQHEPAIKNGTAVLHKLIEQGKGADEADLWEASPVRIHWQTEEDKVRLFQHLYNPDDSVFIGERIALGVIGENIRRASEWIDYFSNGGQAGPHIIPNSLSGQPILKKSGDGYTFRSDGNISTFRFCMVEFDNLTREDQLAFWASVNLPVSVLIDTGGKSIHGWIDVRRLADVSTFEAWDHHIKGRLYSQILEALGVDPACKNPARLSRLPGHFRSETQRWQRVLYLSPDGRKVF